MTDYEELFFSLMDDLKFVINSSVYKNNPNLLYDYVKQVHEIFTDCAKTTTS